MRNGEQGTDRAVQLPEAKIINKVIVSDRFQIQTEKFKYDSIYWVSDASYFVHNLVLSPKQFLG